MAHFEVNGLDWQCCLAGSSKTAPRILIFSIAMGADYSFQLISIETYAPQYNGHNKLFLGSVNENIPKINLVLSKLKYLCLENYKFPDKTMSPFIKSKQLNKYENQVSINCFNFNLARISKLEGRARIHFYPNPRIDT